jgi:hypothetical protein
MTEEQVKALTPLNLVVNLGSDDYQYVNDLELDNGKLIVRTTQEREFCLLDEESPVWVVRKLR